ncbi:Bud-site selection protein [Cladochytrium replicatum]|nr:Bud-site selection protein [Cladochytrium replicatum]
MKRKPFGKRKTPLPKKRTVGLPNESVSIEEWVSKDGAEDQMKKKLHHCQKETSRALKRAKTFEIQKFVKRVRQLESRVESDPSAPENVIASKRKDFERAKQDLLSFKNLSVEQAALYTLSESISQSSIPQRDVLVRLLVESGSSQNLPALDQSVQSRIRNNKYMQSFLKDVNVQLQRHLERIVFGKPVTKASSENHEEETGKKRKRSEDDESNVEEVKRTKVSDTVSDVEEEELGRWDSDGVSIGSDGDPEFQSEMDFDVSDDESADIVGGLRPPLDLDDEFFDQYADFVVGSDEEDGISEEGSAEMKSDDDLDLDGRDYDVGSEASDDISLGNENDSSLDDCDEEISDDDADGDSGNDPGVESSGDESDQSSPPERSKQLQQPTPKKSQQPKKTAKRKDDILEEDKKERKNRRGQRARQKLAEKKYGARAKHLKDDSAPAKMLRGGSSRGRGGVDRQYRGFGDQSIPGSGRGRAGKDRPNRGFGDRSMHGTGRGRDSVNRSREWGDGSGDTRGWTEGKGRQFGGGGRGRGYSGEMKAAAKGGLPEKLHPSWEAKRMQKQQQSAALKMGINAKPINKKIVFD